MRNGRWWASRPAGEVNDIVIQVDFELVVVRSDWSDRCRREAKRGGEGLGLESLVFRLQRLDLVVNTRSDARNARKRTRRFALVSSAIPLESGARLARLEASWLVHAKERQTSQDSLKHRPNIPSPHAYNE